MAERPEPADGPDGGGADLVGVLDEAVVAVLAALDGLDDWGPTGRRPGEYRCDLVADDAAVAVLRGAGLAVWSEESGRSGGGDLLAVLDPVDGSTNAAAGIPYYATSIAVLDAEGPLAGLVVNLVTGARYEAVRGAGARRDGRPIRAVGAARLSDAILGVNGWPHRHLGWQQYRALGSAALELCAVAEGSFDGYMDFGDSGLAPWDYLAAVLVCREAGAVVSDAQGRDLVTTAEGERRTPVAAVTASLHAELIEARRRLGREGSDRS